MSTRGSRRRGRRQATRARGPPQQRQQQQQHPHSPQLQEGRAEEDEMRALSLDTTAVSCQIEGCGEPLGSDFSQASFCFELVEDMDKVLEKSKGERKKLLHKFLKMVNTLLNEGGGLIFIHTSPHLLNFWDEQVDDSLMDLIPDDTLFDENFERYVVNGHVTFRVKPRNRPLSTLDFQSKISLNKGLTDPTHGQMRRLLSRPAPYAAAHPQRIQQPLDSNTLVAGERVAFHENQNMQAKVVLAKDLRNKTPGRYTDTASKLMYFWRHFLKLPHYIAAFAKQRNGGSIFLGLKEEQREMKTKWKALPGTLGFTEIFNTDMQFWADDKNTEEKKIFHIATENDAPKFEQKSGHFVCEGVSLTEEDKNTLKVQLEEYVSNELLWHPINPRENREPVELLFHQVNKADDKSSDRSQASKQYVVEARVRYFHGVCFQNERGPEAYKFGHVRGSTRAERIPANDWTAVHAAHDN